MRAARLIAVLVFIALPFAAMAADYPAPKQGEWIARDFKFHTGETMAEVRLAYTTVGEPSGEPVAIREKTINSTGKRIELYGMTQERDRLIVPDSCIEDENGIAHYANVVRRELQRPCERRLGALPIPLPCVTNHAYRLVRLGEIRSQLDRLLGRLPGQTEAFIEVVPEPTLGGSMRVRD